LELKGETVLAHGGHDLSVLTMSYFEQNSKDGVIVLLNAPELTSLRAMPEILEALDPDTLLAGQFRGWLQYELSRIEESQEEAD